MQHQIHGTTLQTLEIVLQPGEMVFSQTHQMAWMDNGITMDTNTGGGMLKGLLRSASGGSLFVTHFSAQSSAAALVAFCPRFPGTLVARQLAPGETLICRKETFLCAESTVQLEIFFRQKSAAASLAVRASSCKKSPGRAGSFWTCRGKLCKRRWLRARTCGCMSGMSGCRSRRSRSTLRGLRASRTCCSAATACFWRC